jgi:hypothetical protein
MFLYAPKNYVIQERTGSGNITLMFGNTSQTACPNGHRGKLRYRY